MDTNPIDPEAPSPLSDMTDVQPVPQPDPDAPRAGILRSCWSAVRIGVRLAVYITAPIAALIVVPSLALTAFGIGGVPAVVFTAVGFVLVSAMWGGIFGAAVGLIAGLIRKVWPGSRPSSWWSILGRPIRLARGTREGSLSVEPGRPGFLRRRWRWLVGIPVLLLIVVAAAAGLYVGRIVDRRLTAAIAAADRDDPYWRLDDLLAHREVVPDNENSALVVAEAVERVPQNWPGRSVPQPGRPIGPPSEAADAFERLASTSDHVRMDDATADVLRAELEKYGEGVAIARTVAEYRRGRNEVTPGRTLIDTPLTEAQATRGVARLLAADAAIRAHDGDLDGALDSCRAIFGTGRSIGDEPFEISQLVRIAIGSVAMKSTRRVLGQGAPSDAALARVQSLVEDELSQPLMLYGMRGERASVTELIRRLRDGEVPISALSERERPFDFSDRNGTIAPWGKLWFDLQRAVALEWLNDAVAIARRPVSERAGLWKAWNHRVGRARRSKYAVYTELLPALLIPALSAAGTAHSRYQAELRAMVVLLAAERQRRKTGAWPSSIESIDRSLLPTAPLDPFSGRPLRLVHRDKRIMIYSIGPNLADQQGKFDPKTWLAGGPDDVGAAAWDVASRRRPAPPAGAPDPDANGGPE
jgi:hypothetical protein